MCVSESDRDIDRQQGRRPPERSSTAQQCPQKTILDHTLCFLLIDATSHKRGRQISYWWTDEEFDVIPQLKQLHTHIAELLWSEMMDVVKCPRVAASCFQLGNVTTASGQSEASRVANERQAGAGFLLTTHPGAIAYITERWRYVATRRGGTQKPGERQREDSRNHCPLGKWLFL